MHSNRKLEAAVGLFIVLGFLAALFMALQAANLGSFTFGQKTYAVTADFDNIGGLKARAAVKSAGVVLVVGACVFGASMTSEANRIRLYLYLCAWYICCRDLHPVLHW